jgi:outer membrane biosynthesis protein TonB
MSEQQQKVSGGFMKAFLPGLIVGFIVGGFAGAVLVPLMSKSDTFKPEPSTVKRPPTARELEERPRLAAPTDKPTESKGAESKPTDPKPADPKTAPTTPPATAPAPAPAPAPK